MGSASEGTSEGMWLICEVSVNGRKSLRGIGILCGARSRWKEKESGSEAWPGSERSDCWQSLSSLEGQWQGLAVHSAGICLFCSPWSALKPAGALRPCQAQNEATAVPYHCTVFDINYQHGPALTKVCAQLCYFRFLYHMSLFPSLSAPPRASVYWLQQGQEDKSRSQCRETTTATVGLRAMHQKSKN